MFLKITGGVCWRGMTIPAELFSFKSRDIVISIRNDTLFINVLKSLLYVACFSRIFESVPLWDNWKMKSVQLNSINVFRCSFILSKPVKCWNNYFLLPMVNFNLHSTCYLRSFVIKKKGSFCEGSWPVTLALIGWKGNSMWNNSWLVNLTAVDLCEGMWQNSQHLH